MTHRTDRLRAVASALGVTFGDPERLGLALTHRSAAFELSKPKHRRVHPDNERLEFLGDAVLAWVTSQWLFEKFPEASEGELTRLRAAIVNEGSLAEVATRLDLGASLRLGVGEERTGGRTKPSILADALEAVFAAVYLDQGADAARSLIVRLLEPQLDAAMQMQHSQRDAKNVLQERVQGRHGVTPQYQVVQCEGPPNDRTWEVEVIAGALRAKGRGRNKKSAEQAAARAAIATLDGDGAGEAAPPTHENGAAT